MTMYFGDSENTGRPELDLKPNGEKWNNNCKFDYDMCHKIIEMGKEGATFVQMVTACGISKKTGTNWKEMFPEWKEAVHIALTHSEAYYDAMGQRNIEWTNFKGEPQFRENTWKEIKTDVKGENQTKEQKDANQTLEVVSKVTDMVKKIRGEEI